jgi:hypothetical protein
MTDAISTVGFSHLAVSNGGRDLGRVSASRSTPRARPGLVRVARNCWIPDGDGDDLRARCAALLATCPDETVVAWTTAATLHGLWLPNLPDTVHVATAERPYAGREMSWSRRPEIVSHRLQLRAEDVTIVDGLPLTTLARTWRDLACVLPLPDLVAAGDSALRAGGTPAQLAEVVKSCGRGRNIRVAREALGLLDARSESRPESHLRVAISTPDLPRFDVNKSVYRDEGGWLGRPDLSLLGAKIALEYQGEDHAKLARMRKDLTRGVDFRGEGWRVLLYGPAEVFKRPWQVRAEVRSEIARIAPHLLGARRGHHRHPSRRVGTCASSGYL